MTRQEVTGNYIINMERERVRRGYTQPQMAKHMGISTSGYKKIVAGETSKIDLYAAYQLYKFTGKFIFELCGEESADLELFQSLRSLSPSQKAFVSDIIRFEQNFQEKETDTGDYISVLVPTGSMEDGMIWDSANVIKVSASSYRRKFGRELHCGVLITSCNLQPVYQEGDILLVSKRPPREGDTIILVNREDGRAYLRKFRGGSPARLIPVNEYGMTFEVDWYDAAEMDKWIKFGCVLTKMRVPGKGYNGESGGEE
ncbi:MAG: hypothetical protein HFH80_00705 [Lachnospiraceae bacterium]|nr:hypothetical protein [Lachnospiraceae bacterium]